VYLFTNKHIIMRRIITLTSIIGFFILMAVSCKKESRQEASASVPQDVINKIQKLGFSTKNVSVHEDGYLVEGDIIITNKDLTSIGAGQFLRIGEVEQYRTTNLVSVSGSRTITVSLSSRLPLSYIVALDLAIARYNALNLSIKFLRVPTGGNIDMIKGNGSYLASAGFPTASGDPYNQVKVNSRAIGDQPLETVASILAHEIGHCIGFRHTDYMDRSFSCGGTTANEGASTVGAIHIAGTPVTADPNSWMLACIGSGQDRPFNSNDQVALNTLY
jgi:hypothetical protein